MKYFAELNTREDMIAFERNSFAAFKSTNSENNAEFRLESPEMPLPGVDIVRKTILPAKNKWMDPINEFNAKIYTGLTETQNDSLREKTDKSNITFKMY